MSSRIPFQTTLYQLRQVTPTLRELKLRIENGHKMPFKGGQFVMLQVPVEGQEKPVQRAYSIASSAKVDNEFTLLFKHVPGGVASEYVQKLKGGETLQFTGAWGRCFFKAPPKEQVIFVCTGSGLSQHLSFLLSDAPQFPNVKYRMLIGVSNETEMFYAEELENIKKLVPSFEYRWCLSRPSDAWIQGNNPKGRVTHFLPQYDLNPERTQVYLCGSDAMVKDVRKLLVDERGFPKESLIIENFG